MAVQKESLFHFIRIMTEYSDFEHPLTAAQIGAYMGKLCRKSTDVPRQTIYNYIQRINDMNQLGEIDYRIAVVKGSVWRYYLCQKPFEPGELQFLIDCVHGCNAISPTHSRQLVRKLRKFMSVHQQKRCTRLSPERCSMKQQRSPLLVNIGLIDDAFARKNMISFDYMEYGTDLTLTLRSTGNIVTVYGMAACDNSFYLVGKYPDSDQLYHFHVSRMRRITDTGTPAEPIPADFDLDRHLRQAVFVCGDKPERIKLRCRRYILDALVTRFGTDITITDVTEDSFTASFFASPMGAKLWAMQTMDCVELIEPVRIRDEISRIIADNPYM